MTNNSRRRRLRKINAPTVVNEQKDIDENSSTATDIVDAALTRRTVDIDTEVDDAGPPIVEIEKEQHPAGEIIFSSNPVTEIMETLEIGQAVVISRLEGGERFSMHVTEVKNLDRVPGQLTRSEYYQIVYSPEYVEWLEEWTSLTTDAKYAYAEELNVVWDKHENGRIDVMRMAASVWKHLETVYSEKLNTRVRKYKPEYGNRKKRQQLRKMLVD